MVFPKIIYLYYIYILTEYLSISIYNKYTIFFILNINKKNKTKIKIFQVIMCEFIPNIVSMMRKASYAIL